MFDFDAIIVFDDFKRFLKREMPTIYDNTKNLTVRRLRLFLNLYTGLSIQHNETISESFEKYKNRIIEMKN